ncbi:1076_t:CDS:2 [Funneliformis mosseae]|uniref:1076_t:CDS:1 n=1 Tax=Funneliformis mosseae TaxID=27381 RepID=A0A9N9FAB0_FUNMO|nr:1076_t:CDS:2 [Funneliformis mosseae]
MGSRIDTLEKSLGELMQQTVSDEIIIEGAKTHRKGVSVRQYQKSDSREINDNHIVLSNSDDKKFKPSLMNGTSSDNNINELFVSTREALMTVLPQASDENIRKYERQLDDVEDFDPVLIISPNQNWINQHSLQAYQAVMNAFATDRLRQNNRRDENSLTVFHFANVTEMYNVRGNIRTQYPIAFYDPKAQPQQEPIGIAWILTKVGVRRSDFGEDDSFFVSHE